MIHALVPLALSTLCLLCSLSASAAPTYGEIVRARKAGVARVPDSIAPDAAVTRRILSASVTNAVVEITRANGLVVTNNVRYQIIRKAAAVAKDYRAREELADETRQLIARLAQQDKIEAYGMTNAAATPDAMRAAAGLLRSHRQQLGDLLPVAITSAAGLLAGASGWALLAKLLKAKKLPA